MRLLFQPDNFSKPEIFFRPYAGNLELLVRAALAYVTGARIDSVEQVDRAEIQTRNYKICLTDADNKPRTILLKQYRAPADREQIEFHSRLLSRLREAGAPTAAALKTADHAFTAVIDSELFSAFEFIDGNHFTASEEALIAAARALAATHAGFSSVGGELRQSIEEFSKKGYYPMSVVREYSAGDLSRIEEIIKRKGADTDLEKMILEKLPVFQRAMAEVAEQKNRVAGLPTDVIHADFHPHNVIMNNGSVAAVIDFENVRLSQRARDVAFAIYKFGRQFFTHGDSAAAALEAPRLRKLFIDAYTAVQPLSQEEIALLPVLAKDTFIRKLLFVLKGVYDEGNRLWIQDLPKHIVAIDEINHFWPSVMDKRLVLREILEYIPFGAQTLSKNPSQFVIGVTPPAISRAKGAYLWDQDGKRYLDLMLALGPMVFGYANERIDSAVKEQIDRGTIYSLPSELELEAAKLIREAVPCGEMSRFLLNGSDATTGAIRLARHATGRDHVAKCGYHGWHDWTIGTRAGRNTGVPETVKTLTHDFIYNDIASLEKIFFEYPGQIAAVILEPVAAEKPKDDFLRNVAEVARRHGALLIFDELITGFRWALGGAQEYFGVTPDVACFGKAISNGYPLSVICGKKEFMRRMEEVFVSSTFAGFAVSLAAACETIRMMRELGNVHQHMHETGERLIAGGNAAAKAHNVPIEFVGYGPHPVMKIAIADDFANRVVKTYIYQEMNKAGIMFSSSMMIGYIHTREEIASVLKELNAIFQAIWQAGDPNNLAGRLEGDVAVPRTVRDVQ